MIWPKPHNHLIERVYSSPSPGYSVTELIFIPSPESHPRSIPIKNTARSCTSSTPTCWSVLLLFLLNGKAGSACPCCIASPRSFMSMAAARQVSFDSWSWVFPILSDFSSGWRIFAVFYPRHWVSSIMPATHFGFGPALTAPPATGQVYFSRIAVCSFLFPPKVGFSPIAP